MNGMIVLTTDKEGAHVGYLFIQRGNQFRKQMCPDKTDGVQCGDWCPRFGEPRKKVRLHFGEPLPTQESDTILEICCGKVLTFVEFEDQR